MPFPFGALLLAHAIGLSRSRGRVAVKSGPPRRLESMLPDRGVIFNYSKNFKSENVLKGLRKIRILKGLEKFGYKIFYCHIT